MPVSAGDTLHDFAASLAAEQDDCLQAWLDHEVYPAAIPRSPAQVLRAEQMCWQKHGVDRIVLFTGPDGRPAMRTFDHKIRDWASDRDVLLEVWSACQWDADRGAPTGPAAAGWAVDPSKITDWILYAWAPLGRAILLPFPELRDWLNQDLIRRPLGGREQVARNDGYQTVNVAIPTGDLLSAVPGSRLVSFAPFGGGR